MSKYFTDEELRCKCCGELPPGGIDPHLLDVLDDIREEVGQPLNLSCAYRCPEHNRKVYEELGQPVVENSQHVVGTAADIIVPDGMTVDELADIARRCGADGVGCYYYGGFVHVDTRGYRAEWSDED